MLNLLAFAAEHEGGLQGKQFGGGLFGAWQFAPCLIYFGKQRVAFVVVYRSENGARECADAHLVVAVLCLTDEPYGLVGVEVVERGQHGSAD